MKKVTMLIVSFTFAFINLSHAKKVANLPEVMKPVSIAVDGSQVFIADATKESTIHIYTLKPFTHTKTFGKPGEGPGEFKEEYLQEQRSSPNWERLKQMFDYKFKEYFPAFFSFKIDNQKIYVTTYEKKGDNYEIVILDLEGNILKRFSCFPLHPLQRTSRRFVSYSNEYDIFNDNIYYLVENRDTEDWELHITEIR
jgi:hypothetical protein